jgi:hypothetical protein
MLLFCNPNTNRELYHSDSESSTADNVVLQEKLYYLVGVSVTDAMTNLDLKKQKVLSYISFIQQEDSEKIQVLHKKRRYKF